LSHEHPDIIDLIFACKSVFGYPPFPYSFLMENQPFLEKMRLDGGTPQLANEKNSNTG
jgi:hypothetical protein